MPENIAMEHPSHKIFSLLQVTRSIRKTIADRYNQSYWIKAEMNKLNLYRHSGHCYPELVEKEDGKVVAQINSILWRDDFNRENKKFLDILQEPLKDGIKILFLASISFDPAHGISLRILEIDPSYTLGDLEREKQESIARLKVAGIFAKNKTINFPILPQRIAIISVETSKGYADFVDVISKNPWKYSFFHLLFPSVLQGEKAVDGILNQLKRISTVIEHFDVVAIIRGGGGDVGLSCYNNFELAKAIAEFPLPVITGIGHATNETVCEMVAHLNAITPTKLADYLLQSLHNFAVPVYNAERIIVEKSKNLLSNSRDLLDRILKRFESATYNLTKQNRNNLEQLLLFLAKESRIKLKDDRESITLLLIAIQRMSYNITSEHQRELERKIQLLLRETRVNVLRKNLEIDFAEKTVYNLSPENVLKRGYSITFKNGKSITKSETVQEGDLIETKLYDGLIYSIIQIKDSNNGNIEL